jgi:hypothetical protein
MDGWALLESWWAHFSSGYAAYHRYLEYHFLKMTLAGFITPVEATLLLNQSTNFNF